MHKGHRNGRIAAVLRDTTMPSNLGGPARDPGYAVATYPSFRDFAYGVRRDFGIEVDPSYGAKILKTPVRIETNCCITLYADNHGGKYRVLVTRQTLTEEQARMALMGGRRV